MLPVSSNNKILPNRNMNTTQELIIDIQQGRPIILVDDEHRENEGDLIMAAQKLTPDHINFMITHGRGLFCLPLAMSYAHRLNLHPMVANNRSRMGTNFTHSIGATHGITTGISTQDRYQTVQAVIADHASPDDIVSPGHVFPLIAQPGGVLTRAGHTEGSDGFSAFGRLETYSDTDRNFKC